MSLLIPLFENPVFGLTLTLGAYLLALRLQSKSNIELLNPILVAAAAIIVLLFAFNISYDSYNKGGILLSALLKPATVALAVPLYRQWKLISRNLAAIVCGTVAGSLSSILCVWVLCYLFGMPQDITMTVIPKSITTAIGIEVAQKLGGHPPLAAVMIIMTGIIGAMLAKTLCRLFRISDPVAAGLAIGMSAHAIGTAKAFQMGEVEGAASSVAIITSGVITAVMAPVIVSFLTYLI